MPSVVSVYYQTNRMASIIKFLHFCYKFIYTINEIGAVRGGRRKLSKSIVNSSAGIGGSEWSGSSRCSSGSSGSGDMGGDGVGSGGGGGRSGGRSGGDGRECVGGNADVGLCGCGNGISG